jgi:hypothetical protein
VATATPDLHHQNAVDNENDGLTYDYEVYEDDQLTVLVAQADDQPGVTGINTWMVNTSLGDEMVYYWRVRAGDGYEEGQWSQPASFWVNSENQPPSAFNLISPADSTLITDGISEFYWSSSYDTDLYDSRLYSFILATDAGFADADTVSGLSDSTYTPSDSFAVGMVYYWKVLASDNFGGVTESQSVFMFSTLNPGDANGDGTVNVGDVVHIINYVFKGGPAPDPLNSGDVNQDCAVDVGDAVYLINFIFRDGAPPEMGCA